MANNQHVMFVDFMAGPRTVPAPGSIIAGTLRAIAIMAESGVDEFFRLEQGPDGRAWKPIHPRVDGSNRPLQDTGRLRNSIKAVIEEGKLVLQASHPGAAVHQFGATIRPVVAKYLSIPVSREAAKYNSPRRMKGLFFIKTAKSQWLARHDTTDGKLTFHWRLASEVKIPARPYLGFSEATLRKIDTFLADRIEHALIMPMLGIRL